MAFLRRRSAQPFIPTAPDLGTAVELVLGGAQQIKMGTMLVVAVDGGGCGLRPDGGAGGIQSAIMYLNTMRGCVAGRRMSVQLDLFATLEKSWTLPGGIRRRTHPGFIHAHESFNNERQVRQWLQTPKGRAMSRSNTLRWHVVAAPTRRAR